MKKFLLTALAVFFYAAEASAVLTAAQSNNNPLAAEYKNNLEYISGGGGGGTLYRPGTTTGTLAGTTTGGSSTLCGKMTCPAGTTCSNGCCVFANADTTPDVPDNPDTPLINPDLDLELQPTTDCSRCEAGYTDMRGQSCPAGMIKQYGRKCFDSPLDCAKCVAKSSSGGGGGGGGAVNFRNNNAQNFQTIR